MKNKVSKKPKAVLSRVWGWSILIVLVVFDASLDVIFAGGKGLDSNVLKPIADFIGVSNPIFLTPIVLVIFYFVVKGGAWLTRKADKIPAMSEELVLTTLVIVYGIFDLWLVLVYFFDFRLFRSHLYLIPILVIIGIAYGWWAENKLKEK